MPRWKDAPRLKRCWSVRPACSGVADRIRARWAQRGRRSVEICRQLDGLPLAIELGRRARAAARAWPAYASCWTIVFAFSRAGPRTASRRHQTTAARCLTWSCGLLNEAGTQGLHPCWCLCRRVFTRNRPGSAWRTDEIGPWAVLDLSGAVSSTGRSSFPTRATRRACALLETMRAYCA